MIFWRGKIWQLLQRPKKFQRPEMNRRHIYRTKGNCCLGNEYTLYGYLYTCIFLNLRKYDVADIFFVKSEVCSQKRLTRVRVKKRMLSFRSRYQILTMARENVGKSRFLFRRVHKDDESTRKHQEKLNTGPKIKASLIRRSATDKCFTCCRLWSEILISYVRAANICLIT